MDTRRNKLLLALLALIVIHAAPLRAQVSSPGAFFDPQVYLGRDGAYSAYYLDYFSYFTYYPANSQYVYKYGFGYLYYFGGTNGFEDTDAYFYDFESDDYFYTSPQLYPYFYSFDLDSYLYYFENSSPREFYDFGSGKFIYY